MSTPPDRLFNLGIPPANNPPNCGAAVISPPPPPPPPPPASLLLLAIPTSLPALALGIGGAPGTGGAPNDATLPPPPAPPTTPAIVGALLSFVTAFRNLIPFVMSELSAPCSNFTYQAQPYPSGSCKQIQQVGPYPISPFCWPAASPRGWRWWRRRRRWRWRWHDFSSPLFLSCLIMDFLTVTVVATLTACVLGRCEREPEGREVG